jgi:hypothetical protein
MGKQCVVIAVLFPVLEDGNAGRIHSGIAAERAVAWLNRLILDEGKTFPESNCAGLIRKWAGWILISINVAIKARYIGLVFYDGITGSGMQTNAVLGVSCNYFVDRTGSIGRRGSKE